MFEHTVPQPPQSLALVWVLISQPSALLPLQSAVPALHVPEYVHAEALHEMFAVGTFWTLLSQFVRHDPQCVVFVVVAAVLVVPVLLVVVVAEGAGVVDKVWAAAWT